MTANRLPATVKKPTRRTSPFNEFSPYENGRKRDLKFNVNALADFEQETGMGFAQMMKQRAVFGSARAMIWAGLKWQDRGLTIEKVGELLSEYLQDPEVEEGAHTIDTILSVAIGAAVEQGALGRFKVKEPESPQDNPDGDEGDVVDAKVERVDPNEESGDQSSTSTSSTTMTTPATDDVPSSGPHGS